MSRFVKVVKRRVPWLSHVVDEESAGDLNLRPVRASRKELCILCRGARALCGRDPCPLLSIFSKTVRLRVPLSRRVDGSSPPAVFVGRVGYPYVRVAPLVAPVKEDTTAWDLPELWHGLTLDEFLEFRLSLIRGVRVHDVRKPSSRELEALRELAMARQCASVDAEFSREPRGHLLDGELRPMGPSAPLVSIDVDGLKTNHFIERYYLADDVRAADALVELYRRGVRVSELIRAFSMGLFGLPSQRRLVPTRWAITAVDSILSLRLIEEVRRYPSISEIRVYVGDYFGSRFAVMMLPGPWSYEWLEAWWPSTCFNFFGDDIAICGDYELSTGRTTYARVGGCYYAVRLAVAEHLARLRRRATVVVLREVYPLPENSIPVGVWVCREGVRRVLRSKPEKFDSLDEALKFLSQRLRLSLSEWVSSSVLLRSLPRQQTLDAFLSSRSQRVS